MHGPSHESTFIYWTASIIGQEVASPETSAAGTTRHRMLHAEDCLLFSATFKYHTATATFSSCTARMAVRVQLMGTSSACT